jgi:hypothetical protein
MEINVYGTGNMSIIKIGIKKQMHGTTTQKKWEHHETSSKQKCTTFANSLCEKERRCKILRGVVQELMKFMFQLDLPTNMLFLLNNVDPGDSLDTLSQHSQSAGEINKVSTI